MLYFKRLRKWWETGNSNLFQHFCLRKFYRSTLSYIIYFFMMTILQFTQTDLRVYNLVVAVAHPSTFEKSENCCKATMRENWWQPSLEFVQQMPTCRSASLLPIFFHGCLLANVRIDISKIVILIGILHSTTRVSSKSEGRWSSRWTTKTLIVLKLKLKPCLHNRSHAALLINE